MLTIYIQNAKTDKIELNRWLVLTNNGSVLGVFLGDICGSEGLTFLAADGLTFTNRNSSLGLLEAQRTLLSQSLGTRNFNLIIRPFTVR